MPDSHMSRRRWLAVSPLGAGWAAVLAAQEHAHNAMRSAAPAALSVLRAAEAMEISAIASQIIPSGESPGAREAGVIYFIDRALATFDTGKRALYTKGLEEAERKRAELFPGSRSIAELATDQQIRLLEAIENSEFFEQVRTHSIMGFFGNPSYGGNRDLVGWKLIGFEDRFHFEPPFGYYDGPGGTMGNP
ncbi:MAG: gluconate 2-dehydrogenase subunit 3 family protein [Bryobacteraceae bacterium]